LTTPKFGIVFFCFGGLDVKQKQTSFVTYTPNNIINLIHSLLNLKYSAVISELEKSSIFPIIVDILFKYEHNSFCHNIVYKIITTMLGLFDTDIVEDFIGKTDLPKRILEAEKIYKTQSKITTRKEYMPFLYKLFEQLSELLDNITDFKKFINGKEREWNELRNILSNELKKLKDREIVADRNAPRGKVIVEDEEGFKSDPKIERQEPKINLDKSTISQSLQQLLEDDLLEDDFNFDKGDNNLETGEDTQCYVCDRCYFRWQF